MRLRLGYLFSINYKAVGTFLILQHPLRLPKSLYSSVDCYLRDEILVVGRVGRQERTQDPTQVPDIVLAVWSPPFDSDVFLAFFAQMSGLSCKTSASGIRAESGGYDLPRRVNCHRWEISQENFRGGGVLKKWHNFEMNLLQLCDNERSSG
jgi:hypothetical protein